MELFATALKSWRGFGGVVEPVLQVLRQSIATERKRDTLAPQFITL